MCNLFFIVAYSCAGLSHVFGIGAANEFDQRFATLRCQNPEACKLLEVQPLQVVPAPFTVAEQRRFEAAAQHELLTMVHQNLRDVAAKQWIERLEAQKNPKTEREQCDCQKEIKNEVCFTH